jgi:hypothetical protein
MQRRYMDNVMYGCVVRNILTQRKRKNLTEGLVFTKSINNMKRTAKKVKDILENIEWQSEWCHPDKWRDADQDACINAIESTVFDLELVSEYIDIVLEEGVAEYKYREDKMSFYMLLADYIADYLAWEVIRSNEELYAPESATFRLVIPTLA